MNDPQMIEWYDERINGLLVFDNEIRVQIQRMVATKVGSETLILAAQLLRSIENDIKEAQKSYAEYLEVIQDRRDSFTFVPPMQVLVEASDRATPPSSDHQ